LTPPVDVLIVGAGPAGIAAAIASAQNGLRAFVVDGRTPPIDKACGEGLLPEAVSSLRRLGISVCPPDAYPFTGIRFADGTSSAAAHLPRGEAFGLRRTVLHRLLIERAERCGVSFRWGASLRELQPSGARVARDWIACRWLVGADGQNSFVRRWARLNPRRRFRSRFGFSLHFRVRPWTDFVEAFWGPRVQLILTPTAPDEICISLMTRDPNLRIAQALALFPEVAGRLRGARPASFERGAVTALGRARAATSGNVALVGDASCTVDGVSGQGLSLAFQQALALADAFERADLRSYEESHRRLTSRAMRMTRWMLWLDSSAWLRRKALRLFAAQPALFVKMIAVHTNASAAGKFTTAELAGLGWQVLRP